MPARIRLEIEVPWSVEQLQQAVHDLDELESGEGEGIALEFVGAEEVLMCIFNGDIGFVNGKWLRLLKEGLKSEGVRIPLDQPVEGNSYTVLDSSLEDCA